MSSQNTQRGEASARESLLRAQALLEEALRLIDETNGEHELGARLQDLIDRIKAKTS